MKILHTSDWHLGHTIYDYDRSEEQKKMLDQIADIVKEEQPDIFILAGDVYDNSQPSASVQKMFADGLSAIHNANPMMHIIVTAGNHDSGAKHEVYRTPWNALNVTMIGLLDKNNIDSHIIELPGKAYIAAIPYAYERSIPDGFFQSVLDRIEMRNSANLPVVMTAHLTVSGCDFAGHDNASDKIVGGISSYGVKEFGDKYDYLALGHIHKPQFIHSGKHNIRYSGSPLAVSFDENYTHPHSISIIELEKHGDKPEVRTRDIHNSKPLVTLPAKGYTDKGYKDEGHTAKGYTDEDYTAKSDTDEGYTDFDSAKELLRKFPDDREAYIRLNVLIDKPLPPDAKSEAVKIAEGKKCRFCCINAKWEKTGQVEPHTLTVQEFKQEDPIDIARRYIESKSITFSSEMEEMFRFAAERVKEDEDK